MEMLLSANYVVGYPRGYQKKRKKTPAKRKRAIFGRGFAFPECQDPSEVFNLIQRAVPYVPMPFRLTPYPSREELVLHFYPLIATIGFRGVERVTRDLALCLLRDRYLRGDKHRSMPWVELVLLIRDALRGEASVWPHMDKAEAATATLWKTA